jgi:PTH1 family peptidyl-tRNA hydrolase
LRVSGYPLKVIVGLGNPGEEYARTRHNAGFWFADELARRHGGVFRSEPRHQAQLARVRVAGSDVWLVKPQAFMNRSSGPVAAVLNFYKALPAELLVAHDEIDLPVGVPRLKLGGGHGGQNGLRDLIAAVGPDFARVRLGIGHPGDKHLVADYVLRRAPSAEERLIEDAVRAAADVVPLLIEQGLQKAMHRLHTQGVDN